MEPETSSGGPVVLLYYNASKSKHYIIIKPAYRWVAGRSSGQGARNGRLQRVFPPAARSQRPPRAPDSPKTQLVRIDPQSGLLQWGAVAGRDTFEDEVRARSG